VNPDLNVQDAYIDEMLCSNPLMYNFCVFMYQLNEFNLKKKQKIFASPALITAEFLHKEESRRQREGIRRLPSQKTHSLKMKAESRHSQKHKTQERAS
jgi:hypothetical protein